MRTTIKRPASGAPLIYGLSFTNHDWTGEGEYRKFAGPGIPDKGDANDLLCHHFPDISAARAALDALPKFSPRIQRRPVQRLSSEIDHDQPGWDAVKEAIRLALGIDRFKANGYSKNIPCPNPLHEDKNSECRVA